MNPRTSTFVRFVDGVLEFGWLFVLIAVPVFFNVRDYRVFEPDKIVLLRNVVLVMAALFLLKALYVAPYYVARWTGTLESDKPSNFLSDLTIGLRRRPIVVAALIFALVYMLATAHSLLPTISFWGSYDRMEGAYTYLTYIVFFLLMLSHIRTWRQFERMVTAVIFASAPVAAYSWLQHYNQDPLVWASNGSAALRTPSTLGNPIFLAAYLLMVVPFTLHRLVHAIICVLNANNESVQSTERAWTYLGLAGYAAALLLQLGAIGFSVSRGPALGLVAAVFVFIFVIALRRRIDWLLKGGAAFAVLVLLVFGIANTVLKTSDTASTGFSRFLHVLPSESGTSEVRSLLWKSSLQLVKTHPILGCGPEVLIFCWYPDYPKELRNIESANAAPDRSHDEEIDILLTTGIVGEAAYLALLGSVVLVLIRLIKRSTDLRSLTFAAALLAAFVGHIVEGITGIAFSATLLMIWAIAAAATALDAGTPPDAGGSYAGAVATDVVGPPQVSNQVAEPAATSGRSRPLTAPTGARRRQDQRQRNSRQQADQLGSDRFGRYSPGELLSRLNAGATALLTAGAPIVIALLVLAGAQFVSNIQLIQADADYRTGQNYEAAASNIVGQQGQLSSAEATYQAAISNYQNALSTVPTWNDAPPQDTYNLFLGKTYLEYASALHADLTQKLTGGVTQQQVDAALQSGLNVFLQAAKDNPLNPDHPRNIAKLYITWASFASGKPNLHMLQLADSYFKKASSLAPHNSDILDEWALLNMAIGDNYANLAQSQYGLAVMHLLEAKSLYPESGAVYRDLGNAYDKFLQFATNKHQSALALHYAALAKENWSTAINYGAPGYQQIYARLAYLYYTSFHDHCSAARFAQIGLQDIANQSLADSDGSLASGFQHLISLGRSHGCH